MSNILKEQICFICAHQEEIAPLLSEDEKAKLLGEGCQHITGAAAEILLQRFEAKAFRYEKLPESYVNDAKHALLSMCEVYDFILQKPILEALISDRRCRAISVVTDNLSSIAFQKWTADHPGFLQERKIDFDHSIGAQDDLVLPDIARVAHGADIALIGLDLSSSTNALLMFNAKSLFGIKKLFILNGGWNGLVGNPDLFKRFQQADAFDSMFCNDTLAKRIMEASLPLSMHERIIATGTPALDDLELSMGHKYETETRQRFSIQADDIVFLYLGDYSYGYAKLDPRISPTINETTFETSLVAISAAARNTPEKSFVLLVRPHPGDGNQHELLRTRENLPGNLRIIPASKEIISMQSVAYAADIVMSIISTENIFAPLRGKSSVYLAFDAPGMGGLVLEKVLSRDHIVALGSRPGIIITRTPDELRAVVQNAKRNPSPILGENVDASALKQILEVVLKTS